MTAATQQFASGPFAQCVRAGRASVRSGHPVDRLAVDQAWAGPVCATTLHNAGDTAVAIEEVVLGAAEPELPADSAVYGEGFQMLSQYEGTVGAVGLLGGLADTDHYRLPRHRRPGSGQQLHTAYGLSLFGDADTGFVLVGLASCRRFAGQIRFCPGYLEVVLPTDGLVLEPGERWQLEDLVVLGPSDDADNLLATFAELLCDNHPPPAWPEPVPTGWCSWYCFGPQVSAADVTRNVEAMAGRSGGMSPAGADEPGRGQLRFMLIDDGYQARMGDWFDPAAGVPDVAALCRLALARGCEPAIWVAPFIAEAGARVLREHPDWFVHDDQGDPLPSDRISFGGWRNGPWYCLDGSHPGARAHLRAVFARMRAEWGCRYFKLDAQMWGALTGGVRHDRGATGVEAYRWAMAEVLDEVEPDGILLGCNAPMWPSLGLVHAMRVTGDIGRSWDAVRSVVREGLRRGWQHGRLWLNDPDCLLVGKSVRGPQLPAGEASVLATFVRASGGLVFSGDDLPTLAAEQERMLRACLPPTGVAARFAGTDFRLGTIDRSMPDGRRRTDYAVLNLADEPTLVPLPEAAVEPFTDALTGRSVHLVVAADGRHQHAVRVPGRSGLILEPTDPTESTEQTVAASSAARQESR